MYRVQEPEDHRKERFEEALAHKFREEDLETIEQQKPDKQWIMALYESYRFIL